jgi:hypothetical protein
MRQPPRGRRSGAQLRELAQPTTSDECRPTRRRSCRSWLRAGEKVGSSITRTLTGTKPSRC